MDVGCIVDDADDDEAAADAGSMGLAGGGRWCPMPPMVPTPRVPFPPPIVPGAPAVRRPPAPEEEEEEEEEEDGCCCRSGSSPCP